MTPLKEEGLYDECHFEAVKKVIGKQLALLHKIRINLLMRARPFELINAAETALFFYTVELVRFLWDSSLSSFDPPTLHHYEHSSAVMNCVRMIKSSSQSNFFFHLVCGRHRI